MCLLFYRTIIKARLDQQSGAFDPSRFFPVFLSRSSTVSNLLLLVILLLFVLQLDYLHYYNIEITLICIF